LLAEGLALGHAGLYAGILASIVESTGITFLSTGLRTLAVTYWTAGIIAADVDGLPFLPHAVLEAGLAVLFGLCRAGAALHAF